ncbi:DNA annealing helicase and endonuclease ZRANB3-like [Haliotis cracherodii]|uniref:DNA annealing helicase and endonuclease ZRANB3-like n=1 Tax=Haliotis cracherodii TaxID=6455 RepID=UPI0039EC8EC3
MKDQDDYVLSRLPGRLVERLMPFQKDGVKFAVKKHGRCLIADEMGLGKTLQAISVAYYYHCEWPLLIIVPSSLRFCWIEELEKWLPDVHPNDINLIRGGTDASGIASSRVSIVTYGLLSKQTSCIVREALTNQHFKVIICDESHYIKNTRTASSKAVVPLIKAASRRLLLSGTPALAKPVELFPQIDALKPGEFGTWWQFTARYCDARMEWFGRQKMRKVDGASNLEELQEKLSRSVMIRREKRNVLKQLPPKQRQKVLFELKDSSQKKEIMNLFEELKPMLQRNTNVTSLSLDAATQESEDVSGESLHRLSLISKLYKLSGEAKIGPVKEYLEMLCDNSSLKFLIFAYHHVMMNGIQQTLWDKKVKFIRIDGSTKPDDRLMLVQQFQSDADTKVAILSILAAGVGLTLTAAKLVVFAEMYWTPGVMVQCEDRAHRIGQTASLPVHYLVAKGTMDEWVWGTVCKKTLVTSTALSGQRRNMEADKGDEYQVELLSNADAWVPAEQTDLDLTSFFQSQKPTDQRSILEFFTPPSAKNRNKNMDETPGKNRPCDDEEGSDLLCKKQKTNHGEHVTEGRFKGEIILLDSEEEEEEQFQTEKKRRRINRTEGRDKDQCFAGSNRILSPSTPSGKDGFEKASDSQTLCTTPTNPRSVKNAFHMLKTASVGKRGESALNGRSPEDTDDTKSLESGVSSQWACSACTFLNNAGMSRCEMCDTPGKVKDVKRSKGQSQSEDFILSSPVFGTKQKTCSHVVKVDTEHTVLNDDDEAGTMEVKAVRDMSSRSSSQGADTDNVSHDGAAGNGGSVGSSVLKKRKCFVLDDNECTLSCITAENGENLCAEGCVGSPDINGVHLDMGGSDASLSGDEQLSGATATPKPRKRMCFQLHSDDEEERPDRPKSGRWEDVVQSSPCHQNKDDQRLSTPVGCYGRCGANPVGCDDQCLSTPVGRVDRCVSTPVGRDDRCESTPVGRDDRCESTPVGRDDRCVSTPVGCDDRCESTPVGRDDRCVSTPVGRDDRCESTPVGRDDRCVSTPVGRDDRCVSTPFGRDDRCVTSSWELMPYDSPCFSLVLDSSDDQSNESTSNMDTAEARKSGDKQIPFTPSKDSPCFSLILDSSGDQSKNSEMDVAEARHHGDPLIHVTSRKDEAEGKSDISDIDCNYNHLPGDPDVQDSVSDSEHSLPEFVLPGRRSRDSPSCIVSLTPDTRTPVLRRKMSFNPLLSVNTKSMEGSADKFSPDSRRQSCKTLTDDDSSSQSASQKGSRTPPGKSISPNGTFAHTSVFPAFLYCCSFYTGRVYLFQQDGTSLSENFLPLDVEMGNMEQLPAVLHHHGNLRLVQKFVREWNSLTETKKRLIVKQGMLFSSPLVAYEEVRSGKVSNTQRHKTKDDAAMVAQKAAGELGGTVRLISKRGQTGSQGSHDQARQTHNNIGVLQAVTTEGVPLCLNCQQPYDNPLLDKSTITDEKNAWNTRFCSSKCMDQYWMQTHSSYCRDKVYEVEHGICQICKYDAHSFYNQVKNTQDMQKRAKLLAEGKYSTLKAKQKESMVRRPVEGQFWHVDHITPVWEGGGMCDIDNMRTLCVMCHQKVTAGQARKRAVVRRLQGARAGGDITAFFQKS